ncbi:sugar lactone lactonase YvrE [Wenyingzhuangia heitensis]|uniref:Sugar lactone lactonase YvrE n=1 Tax=Wenyingzhuangia heitensis TaxID=1487859 RepID=A0ABX0UAI6_9FLAO|nr:L-dopachrome tautomerase-related protein [Wenyingzhuangia heitensis]NIJ44960.1 sugar lactone lactonase YvrE [Wenyingzhuangia heitensis]
MKKFLFTICMLFLISCKTEQKKITEVASFKGQQVTGVTVTNQGKIFANFPRWRQGVKNSVVQIDKNGAATPYPNKEWNTWRMNTPITDSVFVAIQSVVAFDNFLYVLDTRNPFFKGVQSNPRVFVFDLNTNKVDRIYTLSKDSFHKDSYINDLRIDAKNNKAYFTDSGHAGLLILDLTSGVFKRVLDNHTSTLAETNHLNFDGGIWNNTVHSDGIALDTNKNILYYHSLTGYNLYAISTEILINGSEKEIQENVQFIKKTPAPDGMIVDKSGNLYLADLEKNKIMKLNTTTHKIEVFAEGTKIKWADTFSIYNNELYYTNSRINEVNGPIDALNFTINKISLD